MYRSRWQRAVDWMRSRRLVGEDGHHFFYSEFMGKGAAEKRYVEFKDSNITHSTDRMSTEWWAWLHNRRDTVPTAEELERSARNKDALAARVAALEAEDQKQRLRQFAGGAARTEDPRHERQKDRLRQIASSSAKSAQNDSATRQNLDGVRNLIVLRFSCWRA